MPWRSETIVGESGAMAGRAEVATHQRAAASQSALVEKLQIAERCRSAEMAREHGPESPEFDPNQRNALLQRYHPNKTTSEHYYRKALARAS